MSQRDSSPAAGGGNSDGIQSRNIRMSNKQIDHYELNHDEECVNNRNWIGTNHAAIQESNNLHRNHCESPLEQIIGSIRQSRTRSNQSPIFSTDSTYSSEHLALSDLTDIGTTNTIDSPKSRLQYPQNHQNNAHCQQQQQRAILPAGDNTSYLHQHQHHVNEGEMSNIENRINYRHCTIDDQSRHISRNKHIDDRSTSPTSSSDADQSTRHSRKNRQHSSHRHRHINTNNDSNTYQSTINHIQIANQNSSINKQHGSNNCHRYHEIGQPTSCSPMCDSGMRGDDDCSSSALSNNRERLSSCEDISGTMCSLMVTATTTSTTMSSSNLLSPLPIVTVANYHHRTSSGISCESSTSSPIIRNHGTIENCMSVERHLNTSRHNHVIQPYALDHSQRIQNVHARETKSPLLIGFESIQHMSSTPSKNKCQCHIEHLPQQQQIQFHQHQQHQQDQLQQQQQQQAQQAHHHHHHHYHQHQQYGNHDKRMAESENDGVNITAINSRMHQPPALPPRPPPRPNRRYNTSEYNSGAESSEGVCCKKYIVLCYLCGGLSTAVGSAFLAVHAVLSAHTASLALFETVPSYIPGTMLMLMGLFTMLLARRKHRYGLLMKVCGSVGVVCALVCVLVTVTTTVVHMSRLQGLRECVYTARARSCTCYGAPQGHSGDPGILFEGMPHCEAVHGALYACLRALFGVSVAGILACIFSCMLVYQLLSHEKKKMYWEQLELRCRSLYGHGGGAPVSGAPAGSCGCCNDCGGVNPWWAQTPGNLYTPNPDLAPSRRWRLPWSRSRGPAPTPDSNYGFHAQSMRHATDVSDPTRDNTATIPTPYGLIDTHQSNAPYSVLNPQSVTYTPSNASYSVLETPVPLWGPPPPYSDPNSPARRPQIVEPLKISSSVCSTTSSTPAASASPSQQPPPPPARIVNVKRTLDNYDAGEDHHGQRVLQNCTNSDNYENTEEISNNTDAECSNAGNIGYEGATIKTSRRSRRALRGVENDAFQKETSHQMAANKQSESELYFGDVSSCCGPESSLYELTVDKDLTLSDEIQQQQQQQHQHQDYVSSRMGKQRLSKRSRLPLPLPPQSQLSPHQDPSIDLANERSYSNSDETMNSNGAFLAPDAQYEIIQQSARYGYYGVKTDDFREVTPAGYSFYPRDTTDTELSSRDYRAMAKDDDSERNTSSSLNASALSDDVELTREKTPSRKNEQHQCCQTNINNNNSNDANSDWQNVEQQLKSDDGICPINV